MGSRSRRASDMTQDKALRDIRELSLWGTGPYAVTKYDPDREKIIDMLIWRLTEIRKIAESEVGNA